MDSKQNRSTNSIIYLLILVALVINVGFYLQDSVIKDRKMFVLSTTESGPSNTNPTSPLPMQTSTTKCNQTRSDAIIKELSQLLTIWVKKSGQMSCQLSKNEVSLNGGWCSTISGKNSTKHGADRPLAKYISHWLANKTIAR